MSLRLKLLLPLALVCAGFIAYLYAIWLPDAVRYQIEVFERQQVQEMRNLSEGLLPLVVAQQLGDIHDTLDSLRQKNPEWLAVVLEDARGRHLYPLPGTPEPPATPSERLLEQRLTLAEDTVGTLRIRVSHAALLAGIQRSQNALFAVLATVLLGAFLALGIVLDLTVRRPLDHLAAAARLVREALLAKGPYGIVLSDAAPATTGNRLVDQGASESIVEAVIAYGLESLAPGGSLVAKIFQGGAERDLLLSLRASFAQAKAFKPQACRSESFETYLIATGFKG